MIKKLARSFIRQFIARLPAGGLRYMHRLISQRLPADDLETVIMDSIREKTQSLEPSDALRFLYTLEADLYPLKSANAVAYGGGVHTKHRHMRYHEFFTQRIHAGERVIDIGCGIGALAHSIAEKTGASVLGIDYDEQNINVAKTRFQADNVRYELADAYEYKPAQAFDVVVLSNVLEHLNDRPQLLRRVQEQTQAKRFLIRVPRFDRHWSIPLKKELGVEWRLDADHKIEFTPGVFKQEMDAAQLDIHFIDYQWDEIWAELHVRPVTP